MNVYLYIHYVMTSKINKKGVNIQCDSAPTPPVNFSFVSTMTYSFIQQ